MQERIKKLGFVLMTVFIIYFMVNQVIITHELIIETSHPLSETGII